MLTLATMQAYKTYRRGCVWRIPKTHSRVSVLKLAGMFAVNITWDDPQHPPRQHPYISKYAFLSNSVGGNLQNGPRACGASYMYDYINP